MLRHARKLPDKTTQFYKELNRLKRAAVCLGGCSSLHDDEKLFPIILYFLLFLSADLSLDFSIDLSNLLLNDLSSDYYFTDNFPLYSNSL